MSHALFCDVNSLSAPPTNPSMMIQKRTSIRRQIKKKCRVLSRGIVLTEDDDDEMFGEKIFEESIAMKVVNDRRTWTVGKVSFVMLLLVSLTDILLNMVDAQMDTLESPDYYDALSADVIRPAFRYRVSGHDRSHPRKRMGLGSAAISSVTSALSPILPFTGGIDLRREDYWTNGVFGSVSSVIEQVRCAFASELDSESGSSVLNTRGGAKTAQRTPRSSKRGAPSTYLSNTQPFVALDDIARLTLKDVSLAFRYAVENTRLDFSANKFMTGVSSRVKDVISRMSEASAKSRGRGVQVPTTGINPGAGDVDALQFCAAMRIFAEWRVLRQVPEGYKGYAVGMNLGQKDIVQNVGKIEKAVHDWIAHQDASADDAAAGLASPTLRDLLQYESDLGVHDKLPQLKEKSAAMGLLWVRRQLHYQTALFANVIQVPTRFETARAAISAAYNEVYDRYHGWAVQKIFTYSFKAAPDPTEIFKVMNPEKLKEVTKSAQSHATCHNGNPRTHKEEALNPFEKLGRHFGREWDKFAGSIGHVFGHRPQAIAEQVRGGNASDCVPAHHVEVFINDHMERDAHEHIVAYLEVAKPLLEDLSVLFEEFNMDDPTKV